jgi:hypothetical protein
MAASIVLEEESGVFTRHLHSHNGYYAGDFASPHPVPAAVWHTPLASFDPQPRVN